MAKAEAAPEAKKRTRLDVAGQIARMKQQQKDLLAKTEEKLAAAVTEAADAKAKVDALTLQRDELKKIVGEDTPTPSVAPGTATPLPSTIGLEKK
jgi:hypothetical protein